MSLEGYYPTTWPYKGLVHANLDTNEDRLPVLLVVLQNVIEFWEAQGITGKEIKSLLLNARFTLGKTERAYQDDKFLDDPYQYTFVSKVSNMLDKLAPERLYFGQHPFQAEAYGYWSADTLTAPYMLRA